MPKPVVKEGKVGFAGGKFSVTIDGSRQQIPTELADAASLKKLAGQRVPVTIFGKSIVAVGKRPGPIIICYIPAPDVIKLEYNR